MNASFVKNSDGTFKPDENKLVLHCAGAIVGTCYFDMSKYIKKTPTPEKAMIVPEDSTSPGIVLKGNVEQYPGAFIEFKVTVAPVEEAGAADKLAASRRASVMPKAADAGNNRASNRASTRIPGAAEESKEPSMVQAISEATQKQIQEMESKIKELTSENENLKIQQNAFINGSRANDAQSE